MNTDFTCVDAFSAPGVRSLNESAGEKMPRALVIADPKGECSYHLSVFCDTFNVMLPRSSRLQRRQKSIFRSSRVVSLRAAPRALPFARDVFDMVVVYDLNALRAELRNEKDVLKFLKAISCFLKAGGFFVVGVENLLRASSTSPFRRLCAAIRFLIDRRRTESYLKRIQVMGGSCYLAKREFEGQIMNVVSADDKYFSQKAAFANDRSAASKYRRPRALMKLFLLKCGLPEILFHHILVLGRKAGRAEGMEQALLAVVACIRNWFTDYQRKTGDAQGRSPEIHFLFASRPLPNKHIIHARDRNANGFSGIIKICDTAREHMPLLVPGEEAIRSGVIRNIIEAETTIPIRVPQILAAASIGRLQLYMEEACDGKPFHHVSSKTDYFKRRKRVKKDFQFLSGALIEMHRASRRARPLTGICAPEYLQLARAQSETPGEHPSERDEANLPLEYQYLQHGDFTVANMFVQNGSRRLAIIDWDLAGIGYPPLFDLFCLASSFGFTAHKRKNSHTVLSSFEDTFFSKNWMSDIIVKAVRDYCTAFGLNVNDVPRYFEEYLQIRLKRYTNLPAEQDASLTVNLFRKRTNELLDYYHKNRERLIFSTISDASIADND